MKRLSLALVVLSLASFVQAQSPQTFFLATSLKNLSDNVATSFAEVGVPRNIPIGGKVFYFVKCASAANQAEQFGQVTFACHNLAGTTSCGFGTPDGVTLGDGTASIDAPVFTAVSTAAGANILIQSNCTGITPVSVIMRWWIGGEPTTILSR